MAHSLTQFANYFVHQLVAILALFLITLAIFNFLHSEMVVYGHWECVTIYYEGNFSYEGINYSYRYEIECHYVIDGVYFTGDGGGGDAGGIPPYDSGDSSTGEPGGGSGPADSSQFDKNNDGVIDCYKNVIIKKDGLFIISGCDETRTKPDGTTYLHNAWDITGPGVDGEKIYAAASGSVISVTAQTMRIIDEETGEEGVVLTGYGYYVKVKDDNGNIWLYAHLKGKPGDPSGVGLKVGDKVIAGVTPVGLCNSTGTSTGAHLHLELYVNGEKTCPGEKIGDC